MRVRHQQGHTRIGDWPVPQHNQVGHTQRKVTIGPVRTDLLRASMTM